MGGQAVLEGVMMRGPEMWAVAVRRADGSITTTTSTVSGWSERYRRVPVLRGVTALAESLALGYRALGWSAERQIDDQRADEPDFAARPQQEIRRASTLARDLKSIILAA